MRTAKNASNKSRVKVPWLIVVTTRPCSKPHKMDPVLQSALSMAVPIIMIVVTLQTFSMNALLPLENVKCDAAAKIFAIKVTLG